MSSNHFDTSSPKSSQKGSSDNDNQVLYQNHPLWLISLKNPSKSPDSSIRCKSTLPSNAFHNSKMQMAASLLPKHSLFVLFDGEKPWILGYFLDDVSNCKAPVNRKFQKLMTCFPEEQQNQQLFNFGDNQLLLLDGLLIDNFEHQILEKSFNLTYSDTVNLFNRKNTEHDIQAQLLKNERKKLHKKHKRSKGNRCYAWESNMKDSLPKHRKYKSNEDAMAPWRRLPGCGFSK